MCNLRKQNKQRKQNENRHFDSGNQPVVARGEGVGRLSEIGEED